MRAVYYIEEVKTPLSHPDDGERTMTTIVLSCKGSNSHTDCIEIHGNNVTVTERAVRILAALNRIEV